MSVYLFTIISVLSGVRVGLDTFFFFYGAMFFSLIYLISGECNIQSSLEKPSPLGPSYIHVGIQ